MISKQKINTLLPKILIGSIIVVAAIAIFEMAMHSEGTGVNIKHPDRLLVVDHQELYPSKIIERKGFTVSYNEQLKIPNWVSWKLTANMAKGELPRSNNFAPDPDVPSSALPQDYKHSGYDRGHMAPAGDMKWSEKAMTQCFYMTNIAPQKQVLNSGPWNKLEERCRTWANKYGEVYIICGPVLTDRPTEFIGASKVAVPKRFFKVIFAPNTPNGPMGIGFIMNNGKNDGGMQQTALSINEVEAITGYNFFASLPDSIEKQVESQNNLLLWDAKK